MEIETDVVVKNYTCRLVAQILNPRKKVKNRKNVRLLERTVMLVLEGLVASGAAVHSYDEVRQLISYFDQFFGPELESNISERQASHRSFPAPYL